MVFNDRVVVIKTKVAANTNSAIPVQPEVAGQETPAKEEAQPKRGGRKKED